MIKTRRQERITHHEERIRHHEHAIDEEGPGVYIGSIFRLPFDCVYHNLWLSYHGKQLAKLGKPNIYDEALLLRV